MELGIFAFVLFFMLVLSLAVLYGWPWYVKRALAVKYGCKVEYVHFKWKQRKENGDVVQGRDLFVIFTKAVCKRIGDEFPQAHIAGAFGIEFGALLFAMDGTIELTTNGSNQMSKVGLVKIIDAVDPRGAYCHLEADLPILDDAQAAMLGLYYSPAYLAAMAMSSSYMMNNYLP